MTKEISGQLNLFILLSAWEASVKKSLKKSNKTEGASSGSYFEKGARIETLAREKFNKLKGFQPSDLEKKIYSVKMDTNRYIGCFIQKVAKIVRLYLSKVEDFAEEGAYPELRKMIDIEFELIKAGSERDGNIGAFQWLRYRLKKSDDQLVLVIKEPEWGRNLIIYGYRDKSCGKSGLMQDGSMYADTATVLSWLILISQYNRALCDATLRGALEEAFSSDHWIPDEDALMGACVRESGGVLCVRDSNGNKRDFKTICRELFAKGQLVLPKKEYRRPSAEVLAEFKTLVGIDEDAAVPPSPWKYRVLREKNRDEWTASEHHRIRYLAVPREIAWALVEQDPLLYFDKGYGRLSYGELLVRYTKVDREDPAYIPWAFPVVDSSEFHGYELFKHVVEVVWEEKGELVEKWNYYADMESSGKSVARAFQTKKNIPGHILKEMQESEFNKAFGYVEIDEDCDLDKVRALAGEFSALKENILPGFDSSGVSLRFRKLGKHKALGLYYPMLGCLCVDIRSPSSFIHEYGHCIDYMQGSRHALSDMSDFYPVYTLYRKALIAKLKRDPEKTKALSNTKSKYNLKYYLLHTESFARCFELYVVSCLKLETSLCKQDGEMGFAYPEDEELLKCIKQYFDALRVTVNVPDKEDELLIA